MHGKPLVSSPCRTPLIWIYYNIYIIYIIIFYRSLSSPQLPGPHRLWGIGGNWPSPEGAAYLMVDVGSPMLLSPSIPHACICTIYIYMRESWSWQARFALAIVNLAYRDILWTQLLGPFIHSFIETKWSLLAFWSSSICGYMHTYHCIVCHFAVRACLECAPHVQSEKGLVVLIWPATYSSRPGSHPFFGCYLFPDQCWRLPQHYGRQSRCRRHFKKTNLN